MWRYQAGPGAMKGPLLVIVAGALLSAGHARAENTPTVVQFQSSEGHAFAYLGSSVWFPDVLAFVQKHCTQ